MDKLRFDTDGSVFEPKETLVLLDAQERSLASLAPTHRITEAVALKVATIVLRIGRLKQKSAVDLIASEIARETVEILATVRGGPNQPQFARAA